MAQPGIIDRSVKTLIRRAPPAFFRLVRADPGQAVLTPLDVSVSLPEYRADHVFLVGAAKSPSRWAAHLEYQLQPDRRVVRGWFLKNAALTAQLDCPVILTVIYLTRGKRKRFPSSYVATVDGQRNEFKFQTVRLWEHAERIRSGELQELAPLLVLCEESPTEEVLEEERLLIERMRAPLEVKRELFAVAIMVGTRYFARERLEEIFREEREMLKELRFVEEWLADARIEAKVEGRAEGRAEAARELALTVLEERFGALPEKLVAQIQNADADQCRTLVTQGLRADSVDALEL